MSNREPRFSRRFLTILMMVTAIAILLLSRIEPPAENKGDANKTEQEARSSNES